MKQTQKMTHGQQGIYFLSQLDPNGGAYNMTYAWEVPVEFDPASFLEALDQLKAAHPAWRSTFELVNGVPNQIIHDEFDIGWQMMDATDLTEQKLRTTVSEQTFKPFDISNQAPVRWQFYKRGVGSILMLQAHHMACDAWSVLIILNQIGQLLSGRDIDLNHSFERTNQDFIDHQMKYLNNPEGAAAESFWLKELSGSIDPISLPTDHPRPAVASFKGDFLKFDLTRGTVLSLEQLGKNQGVSLFSVFLSAYQLYLHKMTGDHTIHIGVPTAGRSEKFGGIFHYFVNPIVIRSVLTNKIELRTYIEKSAKATNRALENKDYPFPLLVDKLNLKHDPSRAPVFQAQFVYENNNRYQNRDNPMVIKTTDDEFWKVGTMMWKRHLLKLTVDQFELTTRVVKASGGMYGVIEYNPDLFNRNTIKRFANNFTNFISKLYNNVDKGVNDLSYLNDDEKKQILFDWNNTDFNFNDTGLLHTFFEQQAQKHPENNAITFVGASLTYQDLDQKANQLAHKLRALGVAQETLVGVLMERSMEMLISIYAILKAGGAYTPIDPQYPLKRLTYILEDAQIPIVLLQPHLFNLISEVDAQTLPVTLDADYCTDMPKSKIHCSLIPENSAYLIYTSGSTGNPKGVINNHRAIVNRLHWMNILTSEKEIFIQKTPFSFDVSVWEFFWPLMIGCRIVISRPGGHQDPSYLIDLINKEKITVSHFVPSMLQAFLSNPLAKNCKSLNHVICSGEALSWSLQKKFFDTLTKTKLHNLYGPTEAAVDVSYWRCLDKTDKKTVPIGKPISNIKLYVTDGYLVQIPIGVKGELLIGGVGLARGYHHKPALTAEKFVPDPFGQIAGQRLYKTGDLVRYLEDGNIDYMGRFDLQVKVRGLRIELGEISTALDRHPAVKESLVTVFEPQKGDPRLVSYIVAKGDEPNIGELRKFIQGDLPEYMIPSFFVFLHQFPTTPNGKVDRKALPSPKITRDEVLQAFVSPETPMEKMVAALWLEHLDVEKIGINDNFFHLGGSSITAVKIAAAIHASLSITVPILEFLKKPSIRSLAAFLEIHRPDLGDDQQDDEDMEFGEI